MCNTRPPLSSEQQSGHSDLTCEQSSRAMQFYTRVVELESAMEKLVAIVDFYRECIDMYFHLDDPANIGEPQQRYGLFLFGEQIAEQGNNIRSLMSALKNDFKGDFSDQNLQGAVGEISRQGDPDNSTDQL